MEGKEAQKMGANDLTGYILTFYNHKGWIKRDDGEDNVFFYEFDLPPKLRQLRDVRKIGERVIF